MHIRRDPSCVQFLLWRCTPDLPLEPEELCQKIGQSLINNGFVDKSRETWLLVYEETKQHHQIVLVPKTGRIQVRVHYLIPVPQRPLVAFSLACQLADFLGDTHPKAEQLR
ncbi:MAG: hypothetical protein H6728_13365 [Myxococcales bacterium]|nr:hypothetical protein [Myxococcales bacterium]MCB9644058.1 hypothetical protein [Myxococcales bacterium]